MLHVARKTVVRLGRSGYTYPDGESDSLRPEKVIAETALLLLAASTVADEEVAALVDDLASELVPYARSDRMLLGLAMEPASAWDYAQAHVFLTRLGLPDAAFDALLAATQTAQAAHGRERVPHRVLERDWLRASLAASASEEPGRLPTSEVLATIDLLTGSREDIYSFSHALMYVGDFGIDPRPWPRPPSDLTAEAEAMLARCLDEQDYDLAGEVLLAWPLTRSTWSATATFGFRVLAAVEDEAGFLPSQTIRLERLSALEGDEHTDYLLATTYHTTYVMGLLCSMALQPGSSPPASIPLDDAVAGAAERIAPFLRATERPPHWVSEFRGLDTAQRDALAALLFSIGVRRCVDARQFASVHELLAICHELGLSDRPSASQAAELLGRLALMAEVLHDRTGEA